MKTYSTDTTDLAVNPPTQEPEKAPVSLAKAPIKLDFAKVASKEEKSTWVEFKQGISLHLRFISRSALQQLSKECTTHRYNNETRNREPQLDADKFAPRFVKTVVKGWKGLTANKLATLISIQMDEIPEEYRDSEIEYDPIQMVYLLQKSYELDTFLNNVCTDLTWFQPEGTEDAAKN